MCSWTESLDGSNQECRGLKLGGDIAAWMDPGFRTEVGFTVTNEEPLLGFSLPRGQSSNRRYEHSERDG